MRAIRSRTDTVETITTAYTNTNTPELLDKCTGYAVVAAVTVTTPAADTFADADVDVDENTITLTAHGMLTGLKVAATTDGVLPDGLSATTYYVIAVDANTIKLASSLVNAQAGTAVDITAAAGGGTHTLTPTATDIDVLLEGSIDNTTFVALPNSTQEANSSTNLIWNIVDPKYNYVRTKVSVTAGQATVVNTLNVIYED